MTMFNPSPTEHRNFRKQQDQGVGMSRVEGYGCNSPFEILQHHCLRSSSSSSEIMADQEDDHSRTTESTVNEAAASTSLLFNDVDHKDDDKWLQLSIGGGGGISSSSSAAAAATSSNTNMVELDLLPPGTATSTPANGCGPSGSSNYYNYYNYMNTTTSLFMHHHHHGENIEFNWGGGFRPAYNNITRSSPSSSSRLAPPPPPPPYFGQAPFFYHPGLPLAGPVPQQQRHSIDFRVIDPPPRRPSSSSSGIWFVLQAAQNQAKEPYLPQIPKSFLRIKDAKMTIRIVMKYLANKLKLENESEVEIKCRGRQMEGGLTLEHVRNRVWNTTPSSSSSSSPPNRILFTLHQHSSTTDHIMVLQYGRSSA